MKDGVGSAGFVACCILQDCYMDLEERLEPKFPRRSLRVVLIVRSALYSTSTSNQIHGLANWLSGKDLGWCVGYSITENLHVDCHIELRL